jgi:hypothetical protein
MKEVWKDIKDYEGIYQVSNQGRVRSLDRIVVNKNGINIKRKGRVYKLSPEGSGYYQVQFYNKGKRVHKSVHRLVAFCFLINNNNLSDINHKDGNKTNNNVNNLEWMTHSDNMIHAHNNGLLRNVDGENNNMSKITKIIAIDIFKKSWNTKIKQKEIADMYGISISCVSLIKRKKTWKHIHSEEV